MTDEICRFCKFPIRKDETKRHYGFYNAHLESTCHEKFRAEIERLGAEVARLRESVKRLDDIYNRDKVAQDMAREIEDIFDEIAKG